MIAVYCPPETGPKSKCSKLIEDVVLETRDLCGPLPIIIAGDFNRAKIDLQTKCPYISKSIELPTRQGIALDNTYLHNSIKICHSEVRDPICPDNPSNNAPSDHQVVFSQLEVSQYQTRPLQTTPKIRITEDNWQSIGNELIETSWTSIILGHPNGDADRLSKTFEQIIGRNSRPIRPKKKHDKPWFNKVINKLVTLKNKIYAEHGFLCQYRKIKKATKRNTKIKKHIL